MLKVKVVVPASIINLGPGVDTLGLALTMKNTVEMAVRPTESTPLSAMKMNITVTGENNFPANADHPVIKAASALFDEVKSTPLSIEITCIGEIPPELDEKTAWVVGGLMAANNLLPKPLPRDQIVALACRLSERPAAVVASLLGGLAVTSGSGQDLIYRRIDIPMMRVIWVYPTITKYKEQVEALPRLLDLRDIAVNMGRIALLIEALRTGDHRLLEKVMAGRALEPQRKALVPGYDTVITAAKNAGAITSCLSGDGPGVIAFATPLVIGGRVKTNPAKNIENAMQEAFRTAGIESRAWTLNLDTQGVALTVQQ